MTEGRLQSLLEAAAGEPLPEWPLAAADLVPKTFDAGASVFRQDEPHPFVYAVRSGLLKLVYLDAEGNEWIKSFTREGQFFASLSALSDRGVTSFMAQAIEPSVLERIPFHTLAVLGDRHLAWSRALQRMALSFAARKEQRERELLTLSAEARYLSFRAADPDLERRIPQKDLARHLGVTPVGLNRIVMRVRRRAPPA